MCTLHDNYNHFQEHPECLEEDNTIDKSKMIQRMSWKNLKKSHQQIQMMRNRKNIWKMMKKARRWLIPTGLRMSLKMASNNSKLTHSTNHQCCSSYTATTPSNRWTDHLDTTAYKNQEMILDLTTKDGPKYITKW